MTTIDPLDLYAVDELLTDEERSVRATVARFVDRDAIPRIRDCFLDQRFPTELVRSMAELGLLGANLTTHGAAGLGPVAYGLICEELERGDSSLRSFVSVQSSLVMYGLQRFGSTEQQERWLPEMVSGRAIGCFALTEPHGGSDPRNLRTRAVATADGWVIDGAKAWITNGSIADVAIVWAAAPDGIGAFLVERGTPGFEARALTGKLSLRASDTAELFLHNVYVPTTARLPNGNGLAAALACLEQARYGIAWGALGAARACLREALDFVAERELFGSVLAKKQLIQVRLADAARRLCVAQLLALRLGRLKEAGRASSVRISLAKWNNVRMALDVARECRDLLGAAGTSVEHCSMRHALNLESVVTYEGTESIHELVVGRALTGHAAF